MALQVFQSPILGVMIVTAKKKVVKKKAVKKNTTKKKVVKKKTPKKKPLKKKVSKKKVVKKKKVVSKKPTKKKTPSKKVSGITGLTFAQSRALELLAKTSKGAGMTKVSLSKASGIKKGWSRVLGAATKSDFGLGGKDSLIARGLVKSEKREGEVLKFFITKSGLAKLAKGN